MVYPYVPDRAPAGELVTSMALPSSTLHALVAVAAGGVVHGGLL